MGGLCGVVVVSFPNDFETISPRLTSGATPRCLSADSVTHSKTSVVGEAFRMHSCVCIKGGLLYFLKMETTRSLISVRWVSQTLGRAKSKMSGTRPGQSLFVLKNPERKEGKQIPA